MKKVTVIINPVYDEIDEPGKYLEFAVVMPDDYTQEDLDKAVFDKIKYSFKEESDYDANDIQKTRSDIDRDSV